MAILWLTCALQTNHKLKVHLTNTVSGLDQSEGVMPHLCPSEITTQTCRKACQNISIFHVSTTTIHSFVSYKCIHSISQSSFSTCRFDSEKLWPIRPNCCALDVGCETMSVTQTLKLETRWNEWHKHQTILNAEDEKLCNVEIQRMTLSPSDGTKTLNIWQNASQRKGESNKAFIEGLSFFNSSGPCTSSIWLRSLSKAWTLGVNGRAPHIVPAEMESWKYDVVHPGRMK